MAITRHSTFDKTVQTIFERNAIVNKVNHMTVVVVDAIADPSAGKGKAVYRWDATDNTWILISKSTTETMNFVTEELTITNGEISLSYIPVDNIVWNTVILSGQLIYGDLNLSQVTVANGKITGIDSNFNGYKLRVSYAYGTIAQQVSTVIESTVTDALANGIKTINGESIVGTGDITIQGTLPELKTINGSSIVGTGDIQIVTDISGKADISYVDNKISDLINLAPSTLDTLGEIANQLSNDESAVSALTNSISLKADKSNTYTKSEVEAKIVELAPATDISGKADKSTTLSGYGITDAYTKTQIDSSLNNKVDKVAGKQLSTEDYTTAEKTKLASIAAGAEVNVNSDWNATSGDAQILNKPTTINGYGITDAYSKTQTDNAISTAVANLVNSAPSTLDTLGEIASQLANDETAINSLYNVIGTKANSSDVYLKSEIDAMVSNIGSTEFNTGNKRGGKVVYGIEVDLGTLPNSASKDISFTFNSSYTYWIDASNSYSASSSTTISLPCVGFIGDEVGIKLDRANNKITVIAAGDRSSFTSSKLVLLYTK